MKTMEQWTESGKPLDQFLTVGDEVDEKIVMYFIETLPPACMSSRCVQLGEATTHNPKTRKPMFETLEKLNGKWYYTGVKETPVCCRYRQLEAYRRYIEDNLDRIDQGGWVPVCFDEFRSSVELEVYLDA